VLIQNCKSKIQNPLTLLGYGSVKKNIKGWMILQAMKIATPAKEERNV
jgi:hypothetical protein